MGGCVLIEKAHPHLSVWAAERLGPDVGLERTSGLVSKSQVQRGYPRKGGTGRCYRARVLNTFDAVIF